MRTPDQERAKFALEKLKWVETNGGDRKEKYKTQLVKLPARLHTSGLGATVAFYFAEKEGSPERKICEWLNEWLERNAYQGVSGSLLDRLVGAGDEAKAESRYRRAAAEARALAVWLKRFAEAFLGGTERSVE